jgi:predicted metal-dependent hydrolase
MSAGRELVSRGTVRLGDREVDYALRRVPRRKHLHLVVTDEGRLEVRAPWRFEGARTEDVIREHATWVLRRLRTAGERRSRRRLVSGTRLRLLDEELELVVLPRAQLQLLPLPEPDVPPAVARRGMRLEVRPERLGEAPVRCLLERWYRDQALDWLPRRIAHHGAGLGLAPRRVTIRDQRTRWGSCSARGTVSLNWRLMLLPQALADYVVVHELCHLRHLDHSARFWELVATVIPDHRLQRARLRALQASVVL